VLIEIGNEAWTQPFDGEIDYRPPERLRAEPDQAAIAKALKMLQGAKAPMIWSGAGVLRAEATPELVELAELLNLPVMTTNPGKSSFPEDHPLSLGGSAVNQPRPMAEYLKKADTVLAVGTSLTTSPFNPNMPAGKTVIHATNNAEDINKDYPAALGILGDAKLVLGGLVAAAKDAGVKKPNMRGDVKEAKQAWLKEWAGHLDSDEVPINQYRIIRDLMKGVDRANTIITHDSGSPREQLLPFWETTAPGGYMGWGKSTQLGHGLGITMGAKLAAPGKLCINVMGDAAIGMVGMDLETAARNDIATLTIVFNNGVMAAERDHLLISTEKYGTLTVSGNYTKLADALGLKGYRVETAADFPAALADAQKVVKSGKPALIECVVKQGYDFTHAR
jgi:acetolactate synthase-1/2/3 large subunit